jgi:hypothetical protein
VAHSDDPSNVVSAVRDWLSAYQDDDDLIPGGLHIFEQYQDFLVYMKQRCDRVLLDPKEVTFRQYISLIEGWMRENDWRPQSPRKAFAVALISLSEIWTGRRRQPSPRAPWSFEPHDGPLALDSDVGFVHSPTVVGWSGPESKRRSISGAYRWTAGPSGTASRDQR